jgi:predicted ATPase
MTDDAARFFVLTGGPGSGKTTLAEALHGAGHACSVEAGRAIIRDQITIGGPGLPWLDPAAFAELMLSWEMRSHAIARCQPGIVFFDRGVPDIAGFLRLSGLPVPPHVHGAARTFRYNKMAFIAPPWRDIFREDQERKQSFDEAVRTHGAMVEAYREYGYDLVEIPRASVQARTTFILERVGASEKPRSETRRPTAPRRPGAAP